MDTGSIPSRDRRNLAKRDAASQKQAAQRETSTAEEHQNLGEKTLKHQAEVETEFHDEEAKAAKLKNDVQTAKKSQEEQQHQAGTELKAAKSAEQNSFSLFKTWCGNIQVETDDVLMAKEVTSIEPTLTLK